MDIAREESIPISVNNKGTDMPPKNKPMKPLPKTRAGSAKAAWDESMARAGRPGGSGKASPVTWAVGASLAANAAMTKKDPFAKPMKKKK